MLCSGEGHSWEVNNTNPDNTEIAKAFLQHGNLSLHCIINTAQRELFVVAASCRDAKIISVYHQHVEAVAYGRCSAAHLQEFFDRGPQFFGERLEAALQRGEPGVLWPPGYVSEQLNRLAKERMEELIVARFGGK